MVTFEELLDDVGADAARYWFLRRSTDQQVDFDIEVAKEQSADNPVYYVQYAHASASARSCPRPPLLRMRPTMLPPQTSSPSDS